MNTNNNPYHIALISKIPDQALLQINSKMNNKEFDVWRKTYCTENGHSQNLQFADSQGTHPLMRATLVGNLEIMEAINTLFQDKPHLLYYLSNLCNTKKITPLHALVCKNHRLTIDKNKISSAINILINMHAKKDIQVTAHTPQNKKWTLIDHALNDGLPEKAINTLVNNQCEYSDEMELRLNLMSNQLKTKHLEKNLFTLFCCLKIKSIYIPQLCKNMIVNLTPEEIYSPLKGCLEKQNTNQFTYSNL